MRRLVLIVEDDPLNMKLARDVLQASGFRTAEATTGQDGVALAEDLRPDLILMDIRLPDIDGVEALHRLRKAPSTSQTPVIAVTASAMRGDQERLAAAGFDDHLAKPISIRELVACVERRCGAAP